VAHDLDGNLLSAPVQGSLLGGLTWDARNRLTSAGGVTYAFDAENRRKSSTLGGQTTRYVFSRGAALDRLLVKVNADGSLTRYIYGVGLLYEVSATTSGTDSSPVYYHFDWRGDTVALSDNSGNVTARLSYSPYGERTIESGTVNTPFCFNGKWGVITEPSGLLSMQARFYSPVLRRFLNEDPSGFAGGLNLYAYCNGNPVDLMDPFGLGPAGVGAPGFWEGLIPVWGSGRAAINDFQEGKWGWGLVNSAVAISDVFLVKAIVVGGGKLLIEGGAKMLATEAVETTVSVDARLAEHVDTAIAKFEAEGFTAKQAAALAENPGLEAAFRGDRIDTFFKEAVQADSELQHLEITPRFKFGPDVFDPAANKWWDVTTPAQWDRHVIKYESGFGQGSPLFTQ